MSDLSQRARSLAHGLRRQNAAAYPGLLEEADIARFLEVGLREPLQEKDAEIARLNADLRGASI